MFQFLAGNLEYLGLRLDFAYNIVSIGSLLGFLMLLSQLAVRITGRFCCGAVTVILFFSEAELLFSDMCGNIFRQGICWLLCRRYVIYRLYCKRKLGFMEF